MKQNVTAQEEFDEPNPTETSESPLINKRVRYSTGQLTYAEGKVIDKIMMMHTVREEGNRKIVITGYLVETPESEVIQVQYWRILRVVNFDKAPVVPLKGGYNRETGVEF